MTHFLNGPALGVHLALKSSPKFLRVTLCRGNWDGLDQPGDTPIYDESIFAYRLGANHGTAHINRGRRGSGFFPISEYIFIPAQPDEKTLRDNDLWRSWCATQT